MGFDIYFNSGTGDPHYTTGDNVSLIEISHSDQDYYQNGIIKLYDVPSTQSIGDSVMILIDDTLQFNGYVGTYNRSMDGNIIDEYQVVGKTYDLWRYVTDYMALYTGQTAYIASSLVASYCPGISGLYVDPTDGVEITSDLDFTDMVVGEALARLIEMDGYKFYVDNDDQLHYYFPTAGAYNFEVIENDIISMTPITQSDEDIINDCKVIGGSDYSVQTNVSLTYPSSEVIPSGILIAQQFTVEDGILSAIKLYLNRTVDPYNPDDPLYFEIWENSESNLFEDDFNNTDYLDDSTNFGVRIYNGNLELSGTTYIDSYTTVADGGWATRSPAKSFQVPNDMCPLYVKIYLAQAASNVKVYLLSAQSTGEHMPVNSMIYTSGSIASIPANTPTNVYFNKQCKLDINQWVSIVICTDWAFNDYSEQSALYPRYYGGGGGDSWELNSSDAWVDDTNSNTHYHYIEGIEYNVTGSIDCIAYEKDVQYMTLSLDEIAYSNNVYISGTNSGSKNWQSLTDSVEYDFGFEYNSGCRVRYVLSGNGFFSPRIDVASLTVSDSTGGGEPASGTRVEWSNDIKWYDSDVPYPPAWSGWKTYSLPKLSSQGWLDNTFWMIFSHPSGNGENNGQYWNYYYDPNSGYSGKIMYSWDKGVSWSSNASCPSIVPDGNMSFRIGWKEGNISARASNQASIDIYGRHFRLINDSSINTSEAAQIRAEAEISGCEEVPMKGTLTIEGRTDMAPHYRFSANLVNLDIQQIWDIVGYTQRIDEKGFTTIIRYGRHDYDIVKHIADLESEVF